MDLQQTTKLDWCTELTDLIAACVAKTGILLSTEDAQTQDEDLKCNENRLYLSSFGVHSVLSPQNYSP